VRLLRAEPVRAQLAAVLDGLDAWRAAELALMGCPRLLAWGPKAVSGILPAPWVGVVLWQRAGGYDGYRILMLRGVWAAREGEAARVIVGAKHLRYRAPFYEAEAYHRLIRKSFDLYYGDDGSPPAQRALDVAYDEQQRLALRDAVRAALGQLSGSPSPSASSSPPNTSSS
jgi:hypothetical protein